MIRRLLVAASLSACCLPAQLTLFLVQQGQEVASSDQQYGFGNTPVGTPVSLEFHLRNTGTDATLSDLSLSSTDFSFNPAPALPQTISAGTALDLIVQFSPSQPGPSTSTITANGAVLATFNGTGRAAVTVSLDDGTNVPSPLDFGNVVRGGGAARRIVISNPGGANVYAETRDQALFQMHPTPVVSVPPGGSTTIEIDFTPTADGPQSSALIVGQQIFPLVGNGIEPPFPPPTIQLDLAQNASSQQGKLTVQLDAVSQATGSGTVEMAMTGAHADSGLRFLSANANNPRTATFSVKQGDTVGYFDSESSVEFQTGTTAGDIVFTVKLGDFAGQKTLTIAPAVVGVDSTKAQRTSAGLDLQIEAFDNTRSASKITFTFFDQSGVTLPPGPITVDSTAAFQQFFGTSDLGGVFNLHAFIPVNGNPNQVDSVEMDFVNSAGTAHSGKLQFSTP